MPGFSQQNAHTAWHPLNQQPLPADSTSSQEAIAGKVLCLSGCLQAHGAGTCTVLIVGLFALPCCCLTFVCPERALPACVRGVPLCLR